MENYIFAGALGAPQPSLGVADGLEAARAVRHAGCPLVLATGPLVDCWAAGARRIPEVDGLLPTGAEAALLAALLPKWALLVPQTAVLPSEGCARALAAEGVPLPRETTHLATFELSGEVPRERVTCRVKEYEHPDHPVQEPSRFARTHTNGSPLSRRSSTTEPPTER